MPDRLHQDRDNEIYRLSQDGTSHAELAERYGISRPRIGQIVARAERESLGNDDDARDIKELERKLSELQRIVDAPAAKTTAIGKTVRDPDTGETIRDFATVVAAIKAQVQIVSQRAKARERQSSPALDREWAELAEMMPYMRQLMPRVRELERENAVLRATIAGLQADLAGWESGSVAMAEIVP